MKHEITTSGKAAALGIPRYRGTLKRVRKDRVVLVQASNGATALKPRIPVKDTGTPRGMREKFSVTEYRDTEVKVISCILEVTAT